MLNYKNISERLFSSYIRLEVSDKPGVLSNITKCFSKNRVSIKRLVQNPYKSKKYSSIIIITHKSKDQNLQNICSGPMLWQGPRPRAQPQIPSLEKNNLKTEWPCLMTSSNLLSGRILIPAKGSSKALELAIMQARATAYNRGYALTPDILLGKSRRDCVPKPMPWGMLRSLRGHLARLTAPHQQ